MKETKKKYPIQISWEGCFKVAVTVFVLYLATSWWSPLLGMIWRLILALQPLLIGFVIAYVVNILMSLIERHLFKKHTEGKLNSLRRPLALIIALVTVLGALVLLLVIVLPQLASAITILTKNIPAFLENLANDERIMQFLPESLQIAIRELDYKKIFEGILEFLTNGASVPGSAAGLTSMVGSVTSGFMTAFMGFIFSIYILLGKERLMKQFKRLFHSYISEEIISKGQAILSVCNSSFHNYIVGQVTEAIIIGCLCALGMWILRLPYAAMVGTVVGVTALIPVFGCYLGAAVGALMCLTVSPMKALGFLIFIFVLQQLEDNLIYPRVVGTSIGLPGIWVLAAVTVGGGIGGILGMLFAVPVAATLYQLIKMDLKKRESQGKKAISPKEMIKKLSKEENEE